ncbi:MAG: zinc metalloprotease HtpX [Candidatus Doudnabacteria bacterium CG10_big_fil_rev_8_21_14_0_10_42_18]|uniref:Protease HtpX homolog n=1 Tax=Candidatus Doudnabacteria bacterium CG10_big_fil_rev_8_21_14_0_10_42_18 TaxID=1974552 RepID=A0A2H0VBP7_9BACT|nr:MAG: zinc metalloprotease HtpX [Candidatus Doudnabacteria bacterium CG10_big_fil_rev_8_21_14_0_10_42_18]
MLTYDHITKNKRESWLLIFIFLIIITALGWVFSLYYDQPVILYFAVGFSLLTSFISYYFSDSITLALSEAKEIDRQTAPELYRLVENLCIAAGLPTPKIYIIDDTAPNAFATGRDPEHAVVCFTTGILQKLEKVELEGVVAHELSHIGNYDIRVMTLVVVLVGTVTLLADWMLRATFWGGRRRSNNGGGNLGTLLAIAGLILAILSPVIATLIKLAVSRKREFLADSSGALLTRYPEGLAKALEKISSDTEPLEAANKATAHMYIVSPLKANEKTGKQSWLTKMFNTHPPVEERIKKLREMNL